MGTENGSNGTKKRGRPTTYTPEIGAEICRRMADGESLVEITRDPAMPAGMSTVFQWLAKDVPFAEMYAQAREQQADAYGATIAATGADITAGRQDGLTGVWVGNEKVCAMGVAIRRWTTYHGLALNVNPDLGHFALITPCGIVGKGVTSMSRLLGRDVPMEEVADRYVRHFAAEFEFAEVSR